MTNAQATRIREHNDQFVRAMDEASQVAKPYKPDELMRGCVVPVSELSDTEYSPQWREVVLEKVKSRQS